MAKATFPYVIVLENGNARPDVWTKRGAWGAYFRFDLVKLYKTLVSAEADAFRIAIAENKLGEIQVQKFNQFVNAVTLDERIGSIYIRAARKWMRGGSPPKFTRSAT